MKTTLAAILTMTLFLAIGTAASQDAQGAQEPGDSQDATDTADAAKDSGSDAANDAKDAANDTATASGTGAASTSQASDAIGGEPPELTRLAGSYTLVGNQADSLAKINTAVDAATAEMGALKKKVARKRLDAVNKAVVRLKISSVQKNVTVGMDNYVVTAPLDGGTAEVLTPSGDKARASFSLQEASLIQDVVAAHGKRENIFRFDSQGQLLMHVRETSPALSGPVRYTLTYKRAGQ